MFDDFAYAVADSVVPGLSRRAEILVPMPEDANLPKTEEESQRMIEEIAEGILKRIKKGGRRTYEVRLVQHIGILGYFAPWRQASVKKFGEIAYKALALVRTRLEAEGKSVYMPAVVGSNGGFLLSEILPGLPRNPIDAAILIDARAYVAAVEKLVRLLGGKLSIINTAGDAPALPFERWMVAYHQAAMAFKAAHGETHVFWIDAANPNGLPDIFIRQHLASMRPASMQESLEVVKEVVAYDARSGDVQYRRLPPTSSWNLLASLLGLRSQPSVSPGDSAASVRKGSPRGPREPRVIERSAAFARWVPAEGFGIHGSYSVAVRASVSEGGVIRDRDFAVSLHSGAAELGNLRFSGAVEVFVGSQKEPARRFLLQDPWFPTIGPSGSTKVWRYAPEGSSISVPAGEKAVARITVSPIVETDSGTVPLGTGTLEVPLDDD